MRCSRLRPLLPKLRCAIAATSTAFLLIGCNAVSTKNDSPEAPAASTDVRAELEAPLPVHEVLIEPGPPPPDLAMPSDAALLETIRRRTASRREALGAGDSDRLKLDSGAVVHADVWERLRAGLKFLPVDHPRVQQELNWYSKRPQYIQRVTDRARLYLAYIVEQVELRDLPMELALLPVVESAFQPYARSPAGAAGMWQFIGPTGRRFGLRRSSWYDGRRDVLESTRAALDYLSYLHNLLNEDWLLAVAGYNAGEGNVRRAMRRNRNKNKPVDFFSLDLPAETEAYVPRLLAIVALISRPEEFELTLDPIDLQPYFEVVETPGQIDLAKAAKLAGITLNELMLLNAGFMRHASDPQGPHRLLLPVDAVESFSNGLKRSPKQLTLASRTHTVNKGETLGGIAKRYATSVDTLRAANTLDANALLKPGQKLSIPAGFDERQVASLSREVRNGIKRAAGEQRRSVYRVRSGDSLWLIARRHDTTVVKLKRWNRIGRRNTLRPGQKLVIWSKAHKQAPTQARTGNASPGSSTGKVHVVKRGDSLWTIARRYGVSTKQLRQWNRLRRKSLLMPGQTLRVAFRARGQNAGASSS